MARRRRGTAPPRLVTVVGVLVTALGLTCPAGFAADATVPSAGDVAAIDAEHAKQRPPLTEAEQALAKAKATGQQVVIDGLTTEFTETAATPEGHLALTSHPEQQRVKRDGVWKALDATLAANPDGTLSPKVAAGNVVLSKGGRGPVATMTSEDGKKLALTAPFALPAPTVDADGDGLVYPNVAPDIDLKVTATRFGGFTTVFVVKTQAAASSGALQTLRFTTTTDGVTLAADKDGNLAANAGDGKPRWTAPTPRMWDSSTTPVQQSAPAARTAALAAPSSTDTAGTPTAVPAGSADGPGLNSAVADMPVTADASGISLTPSQDLLAHGTAPYYIDPGWIPTSPSANGWTWVQSAYPDSTANWLRSDSAPGVGFCGTYAAGGSCSPPSKYRTYYQFDTSGIRGAVVHYATMNLQETYSANWSCGTTYPLDLYHTGGIGNLTSWNNQPNVIGHEDVTKQIGGAGLSGCSTQDFNYDVTATMARDGVAWDTTTFGLFGNESDQNGFKRFTAKPYLYIEYDRYPDQPKNPGTSPAPKTMNPAQTNQACDNTDPSTWGWLGAGSQQASAVSLNATVTSPVQAQLYSWTHIWDYSTPGTDIDGGWSDLVPSGTTASWHVRAGAIQDGHGYGFKMWAGDQVVDWGPVSATCHFRADLTPPTVAFPATVSDLSTQFPPSGNGQTTKLRAGQTGDIPYTAADPNPSGLFTSGMACLRWSLDPQFTSGAGWKCGTAMPAGQMPVTPTQWGTNILYVQAQDNAGNLSPAAQYAFYVPWDPNGPAPVFGDVNGDRTPDIVTADPAGDLRAYTTPATSPAAALAMVKTSSPGGDSWANYRTTHRGSLTGSVDTDDLIAHKDGDPTVWDYGHTTSSGAFNTRNQITKPLCAVTTANPDCTGYAANWSTTLQIAALGDPATTNLTTYKKFTNRTGLLTTETTTGGDAALWYYPTVNDNTFGNPVRLAATGWKDLDLISPGDWAAQGRPGLWARNRTTGDLWAYTLNLATGTTTDQFGGTITYPLITGLAATTKIATGITTANWPRIGSDGDLNGTGAPALWAISPYGAINTWTGHPTGTPSAPAYTFTTGPVPSSSLYAQNTAIPLTAPGGKCLDLNGGYTTPGTPIQLWDCLDIPSQKWSFQPDGTIHILGGCLDAQWGNTTNGTPLQYWTCNGASAQIFLPRTDGTLYNPASGRCADVTWGDIKNGTRIQLYDCNGSYAQQWTLTPRS